MKLLIALFIAILILIALVECVQYMRFYMMGKALTAGAKSELALEKQPVEYTAYQLDSMLQRQKKIESELTFYR